MIINRSDPSFITRAFYSLSQFTEQFVIDLRGENWCSYRGKEKTWFLSNSYPFRRYKREDTSHIACFVKLIDFIARLDRGKYAKRRIKNHPKVTLQYTLVIRRAT